MPPTNLSLARQVDAACDRFEAAWRAGRKPRIEDFLGPTAGPDRAALLKALIAVDAELRRAAGESVTAAGYHGRFPGDAATIAAVFGPSGDTSVARDSARSTARAAPQQIGRFVVTAVLAEGPAGRVYRATDPRLGRDVAIRVPLPAAVATPADRERFLREARAAAGLHHPNICPVHEVGEEVGHPFVVMGFVPGQSLADVVKARKEPLPARQAALIARKLALALDAAHQKGLILGELTLAHVLFDRDRKDVVLTGLGRPGSAGSPDPADDVRALGRLLDALAGDGADADLDAIRRRAADGGFGSMRELAAVLGHYLAATAETDAVPMATPVPGPVPAPAVEPATFEDMVSAFASEARTRTEAAVETAVRRARAPLWKWVAGLGGVAAAALVGVILLAKPATVAVRVPVTAAELADRTLTFFLDDRPITAEALAAPVELTTGEHTLVIKRGEAVLRTVTFLVRKDGGGTVEVKADSGPTPPPRPAGPKKDALPPDEIHRQVAQYVLSKGGSVRYAPVGAAPPRVQEDYMWLPAISDPRQLPATLQVVAVSFVPGRASDRDLAVLARIDTLVDVWLVDSPVTDFGLAQLAGQKNLISLQLDGTEVTDAGLKHLAGLPQLQYLYLARNRVTGTGLAALRGVPLVRLIAAPDVTDAGLEQIAGISTLKELNIQGPEVTDQGVRHLFRLEQLEGLAVSAPKLSDATLQEVGRLKKLTRLDLGGAAISDRGLTRLSGMTGLRRLVLDGAKLSDRGLEALEPLTSLHELGINSCPVTDTGVKHLLPLKNLKTLSLQNTRVTDAAVPVLSQMNWLERIELGGATVTRAGLSDLRAKLPRTTVFPEFRGPTDLVVEEVIGLGGTVRLRDLDRPVEKLADVPVAPVTLRGVNLDGKKVSAALVDQLAKVDGLESLSLNKAEIAADAWSRLTGLTALTTLDLAGTSADDTAVPHLKELKRLIRLDLSDTKVTKAGVEELRKALPGCMVIGEPPA